MPQTLTEIKGLLASHGLRPKKRYGQNFLHDGNQMAKIIAAADVQPGEIVLEVGAGTGALSVRLLEAGAQLIAVEIDADLQPILEQVLAPFDERVELVIGDVLAGKHKLGEPVTSLLDQRLQIAGARRFKCIANLPYDVASPLLVNLVTHQPAMRQAVVMVQREVADRLTAAPGGKDYGPLGVMIQAMCTVRVVGTVSPGCFWPVPAVESAIMQLARRPQPLCDDPDALARLVHQLFSKRRKQLGRILGRSTPLPEGIDADSRPEQLTVEQLVALAHFTG